MNMTLQTIGTGMTATAIEAAAATDVALDASAIALLAEADAAALAADSPALDMARLAWDLSSKKGLDVTETAASRAFHLAVLVGGFKKTELPRANALFNGFWRQVALGNQAVRVLTEKATTISQVVAGEDRELALFSRAVAPQEAAVIDHAQNMIASALIALYSARDSFGEETREAIEEVIWDDGSIAFQAKAVWRDFIASLR